MASNLRNLLSLSLRANTPSRNCTLTSSLLNGSRRIQATPHRLPAFSLTQRKTMATSDSPKKMEWLVVVPDFPGVHEKRMEVRP